MTKILCYLQGGGRMRRYDTSIKQLMLARKNYFSQTGRSPIFLSDWDSELDQVVIPTIPLNVTNDEMHKYYFWTDEENFRTRFKSFFEKVFAENLDINSFAIGANGTSCLALSLMALKEIGIKKAMIVTPIYFSTLNLLDMLEFDVDEYPLQSDMNFTIDLERLAYALQQQKPQVLIITDPIFGTGIEIPETTLKQIVDLCNRKDIFILMDYVYGGMKWQVSDLNKYIFNYSVYKIISSAKNFVWIESISKRVFLNGAKTAFVFASPRVIRHILRLSIFTVGSMCHTQLKVFSNLYNCSNSPYISSCILQNVETAQRNFYRIHAMALDTDWSISESNCGYFSLISFPKRNKYGDINLAIDLLEKAGVLTTPHSRYLLQSDDKYSFRVNLLLSTETIIEGISRLKTVTQYPEFRL